MKRALARLLHALADRLAQPACPASAMPDWGAAAGLPVPAATCALCRSAPGTRFFESTRIYNLANDPERIQVGDHSFVRGELLVYPACGVIEIGEHCYVGEGARIWSAAAVRIGHRVLISHNVNILDNDAHPVDDPEARHRQFRAIVTTGHPQDVDLGQRPISIGDDAFIACQSIILKGVTIGHGAVVAAGSVVTTDVPEYCVVAGNPARVVRVIQH